MTYTDRTFRNEVQFILFSCKLEKQSKLNSGLIQYLLLVHFKRVWIQDWQYFFPFSRRRKKTRTENKKEDRKNANHHTMMMCK